MTRDRALSFGTVAENYDRYRPAPPRAFATVLGDLTGLDVLEIAAGTGLVTRFLVSLGASLSAVEPDDDMRAVLEQRSPEVATMKASAEQLPLADASMDLVVVSSAWHWFGQPDATIEISRVLRDRGRLVVVGNSMDRRHPWLDELASLREPEGRNWGARRATEAVADLEGWFVDVEPIEVEWLWARSVEDAVGYFETHSGMIISSDEARASAREALRRGLTPRVSDEGLVEIPMALRGVAATRPAR